MKNETKKWVTKKDLIQLTKLYLKSNGIKLDKNKIIIPVVEAFLFSINTILMKNIAINIRGFGTFIIKDIKKDKCIIGGKEYPIKNKKKVIFKWSKNPKTFSNEKSSSIDNSNPNTK